MNMATNPETSPSGILEDVYGRLMGFARLAESIADRFKGIVRFLCLSGLAAAVWLAYVAGHFGLGLALAAVAGILMALPAAVLGWVWFVLGEASEMPGRLTDWLGRAHAYTGQTWEAWQGIRNTPEQSRARLGDLKPLAGLAYELRLMGGDARELLTTLGGAMSLTNPLFLLLATVSTLLVALLDLIAIATGLVSLVR